MYILRCWLVKFVMCFGVENVIIGKWSECSFVSVFQMASLSSELSITVMPGNVGG